MLNKDAITQLRKAAGLTQQQAADAAGMFVQQWQRIESGDVENPRLDSLEAVAGALGCDVAAIITVKRKRGCK